MNGPPIDVVGLSCTGSDAAAALPPPARSALADAAIVAGGERNLAAVDALRPANARRLTLTAELSALDDVVAADAPAAVVASGDPGFFGVLRALRARLAAAGTERLRVHPAVSSVASVFAHAGLPWDDAVVVSAHGRDAATAVAVARRQPKVAVLTAPGFGPADLADALDDRSRRWIVGEHLGSPKARVAESWPDLRERAWDDPNVVALVAADDPRGDAAGRPRAGEPAPPVLRPPRSSAPGWGLPDDAFTHRGGQLTKAEVRAQALAWLGPGVGDLVWDVGCGSGSVAVECARLGAAVCALDRDADEVDRARVNAAAHGVPVDAHVGAAPGALAELPDPDAVFVGGGGAALADVLAACAARARRVVVATVVALERIGPAWTALADAGLTVDATQLAASRLAVLPDGAGGSVHRLAAANPVTLLRGTRQ